jgi:MerR family transcriptional regulator, heat shock protein HspR
MKLYGINAVAHELGVHPSSLRRWEDNGLISPERATMGKTTLRIYAEETMRLLRRAKQLMDTGMSVSDAFGRARAESEHDEIEQEEQQND